MRVFERAEVQLLKEFLMTPKYQDIVLLNGHLSALEISITIAPLFQPAGPHFVNIIGFKH